LDFIHSLRFTLDYLLHAFLVVLLLGVSSDLEIFVLLVLLVEEAWVESAFAIE
jgi:hypothetical protein